MHLKNPTCGLVGRFALTVSMLATASVGAYGESKAANSARIMWSSFACSTFAEMAGNQSEQLRLFTLGFNEGKKLLEGVLNKAIPQEVLKDAPIGMTMRLGGPSADFMVGRIFEAATMDAYDEITKTDSQGLPITDPQKWNMDDELQKSIAETKYLQSNCAIIR